MRINELNLDGYKEIKNTDWNYPEDLLDYLFEHNFKRQGKGHFSEVWGSPTENFVIKINMGRYYDENYLKFVEYCQKNKNNPHLPRMGKIKNLKSIDNKDFYILFIEKLEQASCYDMGFDSNYDYNTFMIDVVNFHLTHTKKSLENIINDFCDYYHIFHSREQIIELVKIYSEMQKIVGSDNMDMEIRNIMKRGKTLVITDPVF